MHGLLACSALFVAWQKKRADDTACRLVTTQKLLLAEDTPGQYKFSAGTTATSQPVGFSPLPSIERLIQHDTPVLLPYNIDLLEMKYVTWNTTRIAPLSF